MPIRPFLLSTFGLVVFGSAFAAGQQSDPFSEWDRQNPRTSSPRSKTTRSPRTSVEWFSPNGHSGTTAETKPTESEPQIPMRERSASKVAETPSPLRDKQNTKETLTKKAPVSKSTVPEQKSVATKKTSADSLKSSPKSKTAASSPTATTEPTGHKSNTKSTAAIRPAVFDSSNKGPAKSIKQVSAASDEQDPFEEYLNSAKPGDEPDKNPFEEGSGDSAEFENAEPLVIRNPAATPTRKPAPVSPTPSEASVKVPAKSQKPSALPVSTASKPEILPATSTASVDAGPQSPGITLQWKQQGPINVGQECQLELLVQNSSRTTVRNVMAEAVMPDGLELLSADPAPLEEAETPSWTFGELKPGETRTIKLTVLPDSRGDLRMDAFVRLTGHAASAFKVEEPMIGVAVSGPKTAEVGEQVAYVVRVSNPGTGIANNVVIQAAIPEGLEHRSGSLPSIEIGTLNPGESRQAKLNLSSVMGGEYDLAVRVIADGGLEDETNVQVSVAEPKLNIGIKGPELVLAARNAEFMLTIENTGNVQSSNVRAKYRIPKGCEFVAADRGGKYSEVDHSIEWFVGTVQPEEASEFRLTLRATETGELLHQAGVKSELGQARMCDFKSVAEGTAALELKMVASNRQLKIGEQMTWEVRIHNSGSRAADNVGISCELPSGMQVVDAEGPSDHIAENGILIFRSLPAIEAGDEAVYTITTKATREGNQRLRLRVASESISDAVIGEETASVSQR